MPDSHPQTSGLSEMIAATMTGAAEGGAQLGRAVADAVSSISLPRPSPSEDASLPDSGEFEEWGDRG